MRLARLAIAILRPCRRGAPAGCVRSSSRCRFAPSWPSPATRSSTSARSCASARATRRHRSSRFDVSAEFERYLRKLLRKESKYILLPAIEGVRPPTSDPLQPGKEHRVLARARDPDRRRLHRRRLHRLPDPGPQRLQDRGVRVADRRPHVLPPGDGRADRLHVRHPARRLRRPHRHRWSSRSRSRTSRRSRSATSTSSPACSPTSSPWRTSSSASSCRAP